MASYGHEKTNSIESLDENFGFVIDSITINKGAESGSNYSENALRSVDAIFDVKIVDSLIRQPISGQSFQIEVLNKKTKKRAFSQVVKSKPGSGLLSFRANIPFKNYEKRYWKDYLVKISGVHKLICFGKISGEIFDEDRMI